MSELIRREDAINAVEMFFKDAYIEDAEVHDLVYKINHIPAASPWHRGEELPKEDGKYLVYMFTSAWRWEFKFACYLHGRWIGAGGGDVRYWMPIEPPKEDA